MKNELNLNIDSYTLNRIPSICCWLWWISQSSCWSQETSVIFPNYWARAPLSVNASGSSRPPVKPSLISPLVRYPDSLLSVWGMRCIYHHIIWLQCTSIDLIISYNTVMSSSLGMRSMRLNRDINSSLFIDMNSSSRLMQLLSPVNSDEQIYKWIYRELSRLLVAPHTPTQHTPE